MIPTYWWHHRPNFGDLLTVPLLAHFCDAFVRWAPPDQAELVCVGSNLDVLPRHWNGLVLGAGKLREESKLDLRYATILGVRGELTALSLGLDPNDDDLTIGDPGLLADELLATPEPRHEIGVVGHWTDPCLHERFRRWDPLVIEVKDDPLKVIHEIASCKKIVSSSLHGIVVADAFGIPRRIEPIIAESEGAMFKFADYSTSIGFPLEIGVTQTPPRHRIETVQYQLFEMLMKFRELVHCV